jgi:hypothetical protein
MSAKELRQHNLRQIALAMGPVNRWYCSEYYGYDVQDADVLLEYFIKHGGAEHFAREREAERESEWIHCVHGVAERETV